MGFKDQSVASQKAAAGNKLLSSLFSSSSALLHFTMAPNSTTMLPLVKSMDRGNTKVLWGTTMAWKHLYGGSGWEFLVEVQLQWRSVLLNKN